MSQFPVSCVIPVYNESKTIPALLKSLRRQVLFPAEVILVDGGSEDDTVETLKREIASDERFRVIEAGRAMPGRGRNIGAAAATQPWIVFTDAGITLDDHWLQHLVAAAMKEPEASIVYGNFSPEIHTLFERCATISYVPPAKPNAIRTKSIVSCLLKKEVWERAGGFPDWRASEDLIFMENAEKAGFKFVFAPDAMAYWQLRPGFAATFRKFDLYSRHNVWAGRQAYWHYGLAKQYLILAALLIAGSFLVGWFSLLIIPLWLAARTSKRIWMHRAEFGTQQIWNPAVFITVTLIILTLDLATFSGWIKAKMHPLKK